MTPPTDVIELVGHDLDVAIVERRAATCGVCGRSWDDSVSTSVTPVPSGRCPFEYDHEPEHDTITMTGTDGIARDRNVPAGTGELIVALDDALAVLARVEYAANRNCRTADDATRTLNRLVRTLSGEA